MIHNSKFIIYTDGGARGNPGPAGIGVVIKGLAEIKKYSEYIGQATNNEAEYQAVIFALKKLKQLIGKEKAKTSSVQFLVDSELLERQMNGHYKIEQPHIQKFFIEIWNLKVNYGAVTFKHVPREKNREADRMVNAALDKELNTLL